MSHKENQRIALTKRLLQEGLLNLLTSQPIDKVSVTELCRISGINRSTFYNHYSSPQDVLSDIEMEMTKDLMAITARHRPKLVSVACLEEICVYLKEHRQVFIVLVTFNADTDLEDVFRRIVRHVDSAQLNQAWAKDPDRLHLMSTYVCTGCYYMIREWLVRGIDKTPREIAELAMLFTAEHPTIKETPT